MLFNSFEFIFVFLPIVFVFYFYFLKKRWGTLSLLWLVLTSLIYYSWWNIYYLPLILISIAINYVLGVLLNKNALNPYRKPILILGIIFNIGLLIYYKYADFFISNVNVVFSTNIPLLHLALPLAISFFTFQQIAYLVDIYKREVTSSSLLEYALFVTFFPQLIAGPIVHQRKSCLNSSK